MTTGANGVQYAEQTLGVHAVFEEAHALVGRAGVTRDEIALVRKQRREVETRIIDREFELLASVRSGDPSASQASVERQLKSVSHVDPAMKDLRTYQAELGASLDTLEAQLATQDRGIQIAAARMHELGGYFAYLAALKVAQTQGRSEWPPSTPTN